MSLSIMPAQQTPYYTLPMQLPQNQYLPNNQAVSAGNSGKNTKKPHLNAGFFSLLAGGITFLGSFGLLKIVNFVLDKTVKMKARNSTIAVFSLGLGITSAAVQWMAVKKFNDNKNISNSNPVQKGI